MLTQAKYEVIRSATERDGNLLSINRMCRIAGVSKSGYYGWLASAPMRESREADDQSDFDRIAEAYKFRGYAKGARSIHMRLLHTGTLMNVKKIRRLMKKYGLKCPIRKANPYRRMAAAMRTNTVFGNVVDRHFSGSGPRKVLLTDITYLFYSGGVCYLSTILDACTREILGYQLSQTLAVEFVIQTVDSLCKAHGAELDDKVIVHSDQGCHYTSRAFIKKLQSEEFVQSMSRKGNCWDNAPQESFFGHMKDEIRDYIKAAGSFSAVKAVVDDWIDYYNNDRYQWELAKLSPCEYYRYRTTGIYPLQIPTLTRGSAPDPGV